MLDRALNEALMLCKVDHPNVVAFHQATFYRSDMIIVMELADLGASKNSLTKKGICAMTWQSAVVGYLCVTGR